MKKLEQVLMEEELEILLDEVWKLYDSIPDELKLYRMLEEDQLRDT